MKEHPTPPPPRGNHDQFTDGLGQSITEAIHLMSTLSRHYGSRGRNYLKYTANTLLSRLIRTSIRKRRGLCGVPFSR